FEPDFAGVGLTGSHGLHDLAHGVVVHVVEHEEPGAGVDGFHGLGQPFDFDLDGHVGKLRFDGVDGRPYGSGGEHVVVFHHGDVGEAEALVDAPAAAHGVFVEFAQGGGGLARVEHARVGHGERVG